MQTKTQLKNKIADLKQWLFDNSSEHEARPTVQSDLRKAEQQLSEMDGWPVETDTLDIREHQFFRP